MKLIKNRHFLDKCSECGDHAPCLVRIGHLGDTALETELAWICLRCIKEAETMCLKNEKDFTEDYIVKMNPVKSYTVTAHISSRRKGRYESR